MQPRLANKSANGLFVVERVVNRIMFLYLVSRRVLVFKFLYISRTEFVVKCVFSHVL